MLTKEEIAQDLDKHTKVDEYGNIYIEGIKDKVKIGQIEKESTEPLKKEFMDLWGDKRFSRATELLTDYIEKNNFIFTTKDDKNPEVWIYKDGIYVSQGVSQIKEIVRDILEEYYSNSIVTKILSKIQADTFIDSKEFFDHNYINLIPLQNGILNIDTLELTPFNPHMIFFNKMPVEYNKEADCPMIDRFLSEVLKSEEDKKVFYEIAGFGLRKEYFLEKAIMFVGAGRNGKGKSIELLKRLYGVDNCSSIPLVSLHPESFAVSELFGKFLNIAGDLSSTSLKDTGNFKSLTGRDLIGAKRKFLNNIYFQNYAKMVFACNDLPRVYDYSIGFWSRWILIEFPYQFATQIEINEATEEDKKKMKLRDPDILNKISNPEEMSGLLNKALESYNNLRKNKMFSYTKSTEEIKNTWIRKSDSFMGFCIDFLEEDFDSFITKKELRKAYYQYCKNHRVISKSDVVIKSTLQEFFGVNEEQKTILGKNSQENCWVGIKWKS